MIPSGTEKGVFLTLCIQYTTPRRDIRDNFLKPEPISHPHFRKYR